MIALSLAVGIAPLGWAQAPATERELSITLDVDATQSWKKGLQWSNTHSKGRYQLATVLHSDGHLWGASLVDPDMNKRLAIKTEWMRRKGLEELQHHGGGPGDIPRTAAERQKIQDQLQEEMEKCGGDPDCMGSIAQRYSALANAGDTGPHYGYDGAALLDAEPRHYLFYQGYSGCPTRIRIVQTTHTDGARAYDKARTDLVPFTEDRVSDFGGDAVDRAGLCNRYNVVADPQGNLFFLDNLYIPTPRGVTTRTEGGSTTRSEGDEIVVLEAVEWAGQFLAHARPSGTVSKSVHLRWPMNGDSTVGGDFVGTAQVTMTWSFAVSSQSAGPSAVSR